MLSNIKKYCVLVFLIICTGVGVAITLKASIGVGAWDAMSKSLALLMKIKIGTMGMILNCSCVIGQLLLLRKEFKLVQLLQIPVSVLLGIVVNFTFYEILSKFIWEGYLIRFLFFISAIVFIALAVSAVMVLNVVTLPLEGLCMAISKKFNRKFALLRQVVDICSIIVSLMITFVFSQELTLREGTIIGMLIFGPLLGTFIKYLNQIFIKWHLADQ